MDIPSLAQRWSAGLCLLLIICAPLRGETIPLRDIAVPKEKTFARKKMYAEEEARFATLLAIHDEVRGYIDEGNTQFALARLNEAETTYPGHPITYYLFATTYYEKGDYYAALTYYRKGVYADTREMRNYEGLGKTHAALDNYSKAIRVYLTAYKIAPRENEYHLYLAGVVCVKEGDVEAANDYFSRGITRDAESPYSYEGFGLIAERERAYESAVSNYAKALTLLQAQTSDTNISPLRRERAKEGVARVSRTLAKVRYRVGIEEARAYLAKGDAEKALAAANEMIKQDRSRPDAFAIMGEAHILAGDTNAAWGMYKYALSIGKGDVLPYLRIGELALAENRVDEGITTLAEGLTLHYTNRMFYRRLAALFYRANAFHLAGAVFKNVFLFDGRDPEDDLTYAKYLLGQNNVAAALTHLHHAAELGATNTVRLNALMTVANRRKALLDATYLIYDEDYANAARLLQGHEFRGREEELRIAYIAQCLLAISRDDEAIRTLYDAHTKGKANIMTLRMLIRATGDALAETNGTSKERIAFYEKAHADAKAKVEALERSIRNVAVAFTQYRSLGDVAGALAYARDLQERGYENDISLYEALAYIEKGKDEFRDAREGEAKHSFSKALTLAPRAYDARYFLNELTRVNVRAALTTAEREGDYERMAKLATRMRALTPYRLDDLSLLCHAYILAEAYDYAERVADSLITIHPEDPQGYEARADVSFAREAYHPAMRLYKKAASLDPANTRYTAKIGRCYFGMKRYDDALRFAEAALHYDESAENYFYYATAYYYLLRYEDAEREMRRAIERDADNPYYYLNLGIILFDAGRIAESIPVFRTAHRLDEELDDALFYLSRSLYYTEGGLEESQSVMRDLLRRKPMNPLYRFAMGMIYRKKVEGVISDDVGKTINFAILELDMCQNLCEPITDDALKAEAERYLQELEPNFHILSITHLPAKVVGSVVQDTNTRTRIYAPLANGTIVAYDMLKDEVIWETRLYGNVTSPIVSTIGFLMFGTEAGFFYIVNAKTGEVVYRFTTNGPIKSAPMPIPEVRGKGVVVNKILITSEDGRIYLIQYVESRGTFNIQHLRMEAGIGGGALYHEGRMYYGTDSGRVYCRDFRTGDSVWTYRTEGPIHHRPLLVENDLYIASDDGNVYRLSKKTGRARDIYRFRHDGVKEIVYHDGYIFFGDAYGRFHVLDRALENRGYEQANGAVFEGPVFVESYIIFCSLDGYMYMKTTLAGEDIYKANMNAGIMQKPLILDTALIAVVSEEGACHIVAIRKPFHRWNADGGDDEGARVAFVKERASRSAFY